MLKCNILIAEKAEKILAANSKTYIKDGALTKYTLTCLRVGVCPNCGTPGYPRWSFVCKDCGWGFNATYTVADKLGRFFTGLFGRKFEPRLIQVRELVNRLQVDVYYLVPITVYF